MRVKAFRVSGEKWLKTYLGDGVWASYDGRDLLLRYEGLTGSEIARDEIFLGPRGTAALVAYVEALKARKDAQEE